MLCRSVSLSVMIVSLAKTAEPIKMPFGLWTRVGTGNHVLDGRPDHHARMGNFEGEKGPVQEMPGHVRRSMYSKRLGRGQHRYGANTDWGVLGGSAHWHNLANTIEPYVCGSDAALC